MTRTRTEGEDGPRKDLLGSLIRTSEKTGVTTTPIYSSLYTPSKKTMVDEIHPHWHSGQGGPMSMREYAVAFSDASARSGYYISGYPRGEEYNCLRRCATYGSSGLPPDNFEDCEDLGPTAWNKFRPAKPKVSLGQFLAELRDFPKLFQVKLRKFKDLGSGYLNAQFGWRPFLSDIRRSVQTFKRLDDHLARLKKNNGKWLKRGGTLFETNESNKTAISAPVYLAPRNYTYDHIGVRTVTTYSRAWFKGSFRYHIPGLQENEWGSFRSFRRLYGLELTPSLVYELTPWSWLFDWVSNTGDVIENLQAVQFDNMAAQRAYVMLKTETKSEVEVSFRARFTLDGNQSYTSHCSRSNESHITKCRAEASPFGFNMNWDDFNPFQLSILTALGIQYFSR